MSSIVEEKKREAGIELCRIFCCLCVIAVHTTHFRQEALEVSFLWTLAKCSATPVFFLITGFFYSPAKPFSAYMTRLLGRVVIPVIVTMLLIAQLTPWLSGQTSLTQSMETVQWRNFALVGEIWINFWPYEYLPDYNPFGPLWFTFAFILCYLFFPLLAVMCGNGREARALRRYFLCLGLVVFVLNGSLRTLFTGTAVFAQLDWGIPQKPFYWLWLILLGYQVRIFVRERQETLARLRPVLIASGLALFLTGGVILFHLTRLHDMDANGYVSQHFFAREFVIYLAAQLGIFMVFALLPPIARPSLAEPIRFIANKVFYIYIIHDPVFKIVLAHIPFDVSRVDDYLALIAVTFATSLSIACGLKKAETLIASSIKNFRWKSPRKNPAASAP